VPVLGWVPEQAVLVDGVYGPSSGAGADEVARGIQVGDAACYGHKRFVVDMTGTRFCDASTSHVLAAARRRALDEGRQMLLAVSDAGVLRVFALTGIDRMIPTFASLDEALGHAAADGSHLSAG